MLLIDAHEDLAYNALNFGRDYHLSAAEIRQAEAGTLIPTWNGGQAMLGYPDFQRGQVGLVFGTVFVTHKRHAHGSFEKLVYLDSSQARRLYHQQVDYYHHLADRYPSCFCLVRSRKELAETLQPWEDAVLSGVSVNLPVGIVISMEGAEGIEDPGELEEYWQKGLRIIGPVWAGGALCGGTIEPGRFTRQGYALLAAMAALGFTLDLSHMNEESALQALDVFAGPVIASHANPRALLKDPHNERHLTDRTIQALAERDGVIGIIPYNRFLKPGWSDSHDRSQVRLEDVAAHIDYVCQLAGNARHVAIGSDFDGGFGWPAVPAEIDTIADLQKLVPVLSGRGYQPADILAIFKGNWLRILERSLPER
jgi:membrane dipeptidase